MALYRRFTQSLLWTTHCTTIIVHCTVHNDSCTQYSSQLTVYTQGCTMFRRWAHPEATQSWTPAGPPETYIYISLPKKFCLIHVRMVKPLFWLPGVDTASGGVSEEDHSVWQGREARWWRTLGGRGVFILNYGRKRIQPLSFDTKGLLMDSFIYEHDTIFFFESF